MNKTFQLVFFLSLYVKISEQIVCKNGGVLQKDGKSCECPSRNIMGSECQIILCENGGRSRNKTSGPFKKGIVTEHCFCQHGFGGEFCQISLSPKLACINGFSQRRDSLAFCRCEPLWKGRLCDQITCINGRAHQTKSGMYYYNPSICYCHIGWHGKHCERRKCYRGNLDKDNTEQCICDYGYYGPYCDRIKCFGGFSVNGSCHCNCGYTGSHCNIRTRCRDHEVYSRRPVRVTMALLAVLALLLLAVISFYRKQMERNRASLLFSTITHHNRNNSRCLRRLRYSHNPTLRVDIQVRVNEESESEVASTHEPPPTYEQCENENESQPPTYEEATNNDPKENNDK